MSTYTPEKLLKEYGNHRMDVEMAMGHVLQHIEILDDAKTKASTSHHKLGEYNKQQDAKIKTLENEVKQLRQKATKVSTLEQQVITLAATIQQQKNEFDSLKMLLQQNCNEVNRSATRIHHFSTFGLSSFYPS